VVVAIIVAVFWRGVVDIAVDWMWFESLGHLAVYKTTLFMRMGLTVGGFLVASSVTALSLFVAAKRAPIEFWRLQLAATAGEDALPLDPKRLKRIVQLAAVGAAVLVGSMFSQATASSWLDVLSYLHQVPFEATDPVFERDISFYVFTLPLLQFIRRITMGILAFTGMATAVWYLLSAAAQNPQRPELPDTGRTHLLLIGALMLVVSSVGWWLSRFELLVETNGAVVGIGYADEVARLPGYALAALVALVAAGVLLFATRRPGWRLPLITVATTLGANYILTVAVPKMTEQYVVQPSQLELERPYLTRNIQGTRTAYALDRIDVRPFEAETGLTMTDIQNNPDTVENIRVWDTRPLLTTYSQLQEIRTYYDFMAVDVDRYDIDGSSRQVMLAVREMNVDALPGAGNWVNQHLQYTHGYGFTMSPVNVVTPDGLPELFVQDIPPTTTIDLDVSRPEVYYGERTNDYVIVRTGEKEFDYPMGENNVTTTYEGTGGVELTSALRTLLFAGHLENLDILLSQYIRRDSRVLLHRNIRRRVSRVAPFLAYDADPYAVVVNGGIHWILDAYTVTDRYPYSERTQVSNQGIRANYIRNSVKVVVNAYNGTVDFYVSDPSDPIIQTYAKIFPGTFHAREDLPEELTSHLRYPSDFFDTQAKLYAQYHMQDPTVFFNREDLWDIPIAAYANSDRMDSYYLIMKLPGEEAAEFILLIPFVPQNKDNMIAWMAARSDGEHYGRLIVYTFPKKKLIFGPAQIESRFDQTPEISEQLTLWDQAGSSVVRGNLLAIPIEDSLMYVEPIYLQAGSADRKDRRRELPELKRVIVTHDKRIAMAPTLDEAMAQVFGSMPENLPARALSRTQRKLLPPVIDDDSNQTDTQLVSLARNALLRAEERQRAGDWAGYGEALLELKDHLNRLDARAPTSEAPDQSTDASQPDSSAPEAPAPAGK
jgi:uncharacterized membrane protein (UPF0182 family)